MGSGRSQLTHLARTRPSAFRFPPPTDKAGDAAVKAAKAGDLELRNVSFSYPLRADMPGA
jgi:hypothetical protein